jgi:hypothetical protein
MIRSILTRVPLTSFSSQNHIATDGQLVSLSFEPHLGFMTRYLLLFDSYGLVFVGALSDEWLYGSVVG